MRHRKDNLSPKERRLYRTLHVLGVLVFSVSLAVLFWVDHSVWMAAAAIIGLVFGLAAGIFNMAIYLDIRVLWSKRFRDGP